ncbi:hypothetical protein [Gryllotalpicola sp.]|uniref:hypothetical protein n=1 Tax=Gryllotalpicola sp. TaxID=1932787 RepID=UPI00262677A5|nr:hypothetical protein [Gryllotalpicola sp.]
MSIAALVEWRSGVPVLAPLDEAADGVAVWEGAAYSARLFVRGGGSSCGARRRA